MRRARPLTAIVLLAAALLPSAAAPVLAQGQDSSEQARILAYWTPQRIAHAIPRDFVLTSAGQFVPDKGKPGSGGGNNVTGASWTGGGQIVTTSGKVLFTMAGTDYICSGAVINDNRSNYSIVLTAGHCSYDETDGAFATNWMFYPAFDVNQTYDCASSAYGCWTASALVVDSGFATAGGFNTQATVHDWSFGVVGPGGLSGTAQLDAVADSFGYSFTDPGLGAQVFDFGYPAAGKYHGYDLTYCSDQVFYDANNGNNTLGIDCNMTGGSSGGPWLTNFNTSTGIGTLSSVNSYGYTSIKNKEYGPKFNDNTSTTYAAATNATTGDVIVNVPN